MDIKKYGQQYELPENRDEFVDVEKGAVIDKKDIPPIEIIKEMAKRFSVNIKNPNSGCRHCYGRGYSGIDAKTQAPIPCTCLFRDRDSRQKYQDTMASQGLIRMNHDARRRMQKNIRRGLVSTQPVLPPVKPSPVTAVSATTDVDIFKAKSEV
jgi:hypothetical protein